MGKVVPDSLFGPWKKYFHTYRKFTKNIKWQNYGELKRRYSFLNCGQVICLIIISIVQQCRRQCTSPCRWCEEVTYLRLARQSPCLLLQNLLIASKHPHKFLSICCRCLFLPVSFRHLDAIFNEIKPLSQIWNCHDPLLKFRCLSFFKGILLPNFKMVKCEHLIMVVQQLDTFSDVRTHLHTCPNAAYWVWGKTMKMQNSTSWWTV